MCLAFLPDGLSLSQLWIFQTNPSWCSGPRETNTPAGTSLTLHAGLISRPRSRWIGQKTVPRFGHVCDSPVNKRLGESLGTTRRSKRSYTCITSSWQDLTFMSRKGYSPPNIPSLFCSGLGVMAYEASRSTEAARNSGSCMLSVVHRVYEPGDFADPSYSMYMK